MHTHTHTHTRLTALFPELSRWAGTRNAKPIWILLKQETVSSSGISWAMCKSAPRSREITMPVTHHSVFTGRMIFLPPNQQHQSTEGIHRQIKPFQGFFQMYFMYNSQLVILNNFVLKYHLWHQPASSNVNKCKCNSILKDVCIDMQHTTNKT